MTRHPADGIARVPPAASHAGRSEPASATRAAVCAMDDAVVAMIAACERYAGSYASAHRRPIGCDPARGPILLDVLRSIAALTGDAALHDRAFEVISDHALDLEQ